MEYKRKDPQSDSAQEQEEENLWEAEENLKEEGLREEGRKVIYLPVKEKRDCPLPILENLQKMRFLSYHRL